MEQVALVTGGASGIGLSITGELADAGYKVGVIGRNSKSLSALENNIPSAFIHIGDVNQQSDLQGFFTGAHESLGKTDVLVVNAGISAFTPLASTQEETFDSIINTNVKAAFFTVQKALPFMKENGRIILVSSALHLKAVPGLSVYAASKAALRSLAKSFAAELLDRGIRVNTVSPGPTHTPLFTKLGLNTKNEDESDNTALLGGVPMQRFATPTEIAKAALFLASEDSSYMTGADLLVDGGLTGG